MTPKRVSERFQTLVEKVYINLALLGGHNYTENDVKEFHTDSKEGLFQGMEVPLSEAQQQIIDHVSAQKNQGLRVTLKSIEERFERKNYGWPSVAIREYGGLWHGKTEARQNSNQLTDERLITALKATVNGMTALFLTFGSNMRHRKSSFEELLFEFLAPLLALRTVPASRAR